MSQDSSSDKFEKKFDKPDTSSDPTAVHQPSAWTPQQPQDPYGQQGYDPYGQPPGDPYGQPPAGTPYGQPPGDLGHRAFAQDEVSSKVRGGPLAAQGGRIRPGSA